MATALLLSIHARDIISIVLFVLWLLAIVVCIVVNYCFEHGLVHRWIERKNAMNNLKKK